MNRFMVNLENTDVTIESIKKKVESLGFARCLEDNDCNFDKSK